MPPREKAVANEVRLKIPSLSQESKSLDRVGQRIDKSKPSRRRGDRLPLPSWEWHPPSLLWRTVEESRIEHQFFEDREAGEVPHASLDDTERGHTHACDVYGRQGGGAVIFKRLQNSSDARFVTSRSV